MINFFCYNSVINKGFMMVWIDSLFSVSCEVAVPTSIPKSISIPVWAIPGWFKSPKSVGDVSQYCIMVVVVVNYPYFTSTSWPGPNHFCYKSIDTAKPFWASNSGPYINLNYIFYIYINEYYFFIKLLFFKFIC